MDKRIIDGVDFQGEPFQYEVDDEPEDVPVEGPDRYDSEGMPSY